MRIPGFTAESAVYTPPETYRQNSWGLFVGNGAAVTPARRGFPCSMCEEICAGGTGICDRWCARACRGGTHCGHPD
jgi:hypothetical protein